LNLLDEPEIHHQRLLVRASRMIATQALASESNKTSSRAHNFLNQAKVKEMHNETERHATQSLCGSGKISQSRISYQASEILAAA